MPAETAQCMNLYPFNLSSAPLGQQNQFALLGLTNSAGAVIGNTNFADPIISCPLLLGKSPPVLQTCSFAIHLDCGEMEQPNLPVLCLSPPGSASSLSRSNKGSYSPQILCCHVEWISALKPQMRPADNARSMSSPIQQVH
jgi:hypothetical protein